MARADVDLVLVEVGEVVDDDGYGQGDDEHTADAARGADQLAADRRRAHVAVADRRHGDRRPPERLRDADELGAGHVVLGEVGERREDEHADRDEHHQQAELLPPWTQTQSTLTYFAPATNRAYRVAPKIGTICLYALTLKNINRCSKLFHAHNQEKICNNNRAYH